MAKILIVDDQRINREYLNMLLGDDGHQLLEAADGAEGLAVARTECPDVIIADILMPTMDGYELVRQLRADQAIAATPVIFYTAHYHERETRALADACGVFHILTKPAEPDQVISTVNAALGGYRDVGPPSPPQEEFDREHLQVMTDKLSQKTAEVRKAHERLTALLDHSLDLGAMRDHRQLLRSLGYAARKIIGAKYAVVGILNGDGVGLRYFFTSGMDAETVTRLGSPDHRRGGIKAVLRDSRCIRLRNSGGSPAAIDFPPSYPPVYSWLGAPILSPGHVYGWVGLLNKLGADEFSDEDQRLAGALAAQVGRIYENGGLYVDMQRHAAELELEVAERKRAEAFLKESEERFRQLAENIREVFWLSDPVNGAILYISPAYEVVWGRPCATLYNSPRAWLEAIHVEDRERVREAFSTKQMAGQYDEEYRIARPDGSIRWIHDRGFPVRNAAGEVYRVAGVAEDITDRKRAAEELQGAQIRLQHVISSSPAVLFTMSGRDGKQIQNVNWISANMLEVFGHPPEDGLSPQWWPENVHADDWDKIVVQFQADLLGQERSSYEYRLRHRDGNYRWVRSQLRLIRDNTGQAVEIIGSLSDVTERKLLEDQFRQAQKMEAVGQLAGGVAHDFNNLLTIINGYSQLLLQNAKLDELARGFLTEILKAGERSAGLTSQLLAFSRKQVIIPRALDLNSVIAGAEKMLQRMIGEDVELVSVLAPGLGSVKADAGQMEQVLLNLAVNARDAMPTGGKLTIETKDIILGDEHAHGHFSVRPGSYVLLAVSDNGCGMTEEVKARVFEPFFTTKGEGYGTGLGLATVYGIVKQLEGHIGIHSEVGTGTSFKIYLPRFNAPARKSKSESSEIPIPRGTETILLVEDEPGLRGFLRQVLADAGYSLLVAGNGIEALRIAKEHPGPIDCVVTDVVMPGLGGRQVVEQLVFIHPKVKVLYLSGYTDDAIVRHGIMHEQVPFLQKPFSPLILAKKVRDILDT